MSLSTQQWFQRLHNSKISMGPHVRWIGPCWGGGGGAIDLASKKSKHSLKQEIKRILFPLVDFHIYYYMAKWHIYVNFQLGVNNKFHMCAVLWLHNGKA